MITPWDVSGGADGKVDYEKLVRDVSEGKGQTVWMAAGQSQVKRCSGPADKVQLANLCH